MYPFGPSNKVIVFYLLVDSIIKTKSKRTWDNKDWMGFTNSVYSPPKILFKSESCKPYSWETSDYFEKEQIWEMNL